MPKQVIVTKEGFQNKASELAGLAWDAGESKVTLEVKDGQGFREGRGWFESGWRFRERRKSDDDNE